MEAEKRVKINRGTSIGCRQYNNLQCPEKERNHQCSEKQTPNRTAKDTINSHESCEEEAQKQQQEQPPQGRGEGMTM